MSGAEKRSVWFVTYGELYVPPISAMDFIRAARVPESVEPREFFPWQIIRRRSPSKLLGFDTQTMLCRWGWGSMHQQHGEIVMDDSLPELRRHLPIWMAARGRVLKTGLGLGCVPRGLLINPAVEHIDIVEIDAAIIDAIGPEFEGNPRVTIHHADAHTWDFGDRRWDYIWHDIHDNAEEQNLIVQHARLMVRYLDATPLDRQGAWAFPREVARRLPARLLGAPKA